MPRYRYKATDHTGRKIVGNMAAADEAALFELLKSEGIYLISAKIQNKRYQGKQLKAAALADFCRQLGTLLRAGVPLSRALLFTAQNDSIEAKHRAIYTELLRRIRQGEALSVSMEDMGNVFPPMMIHMLRASESAGNMDKAANQLAIQYSKESRLNEKVKSSMAYPKFLSCLIVAVVAVLMGFVLPQFESLFTLMDELPLPTRILYSITNFTSQYWHWMILAGIVLAICVRMVCSIGVVRIRLDKMKVHMPIMGKLLKVIYTARFARILTSLYGAGIPVVTSLQIAKSSVGNAYIESQFEKAAAVVQGGGTLSDGVESIDGFINKLAFAVRVGEETGSLETMLETTAEELEYESEIAVNRMVSYIEPAMIIIMAFIVGFVMLAVMMPIYASYAAIETSAYN